MMRINRCLEFAIPGCFLVVCAAQIARPLNFDEGIYFTIARDTRQFYVPAWTWDGETYRLFANSPALGVYLAAPLQHWSPDVNIWVTRLLFEVLFVAAPTLALWALLRNRYGLLASTVGVGLAFTTWTFLDEAFRFRLDVPLGAACAGTLFYYHKAARADTRWSGSLLVATILMILSCWIKFQAVCVLAAVLIYWCYAEYSGRRFELPHLRTATVAVVLAAGLAGASWVVFTHVAMRHLAVAQTLHAAPGGFGEILFYNLSRIAGEFGDPRWLQHFVTVVLQPMVNRVGFVLVLVAVAWALVGRMDSLALLAAYYCGITVVFNLAVFHMPGAGNNYLAAAVPTACVLVAWAISAVEAVPSVPRFRWIIAITIGLHVALNVPKLNQILDMTDPTRQAAATVASRAPDGVIALSDQMWSIGYFTGRRLAHLAEMPTAQIYKLLSAGSARAAAVVVTDSYVRSLGRQDFTSALEENFTRVNTISLSNGDEIWVYLPRGF